MTRSKLDIFAQILDKAKTGTTKTGLVYQANLNQKLATSALRLLVDLDLMLVRTNSPTSYVTSDKGLKFLREYAHLHELMESK